MAYQYPLRRERLLNQIKADGLDALLVSSEVNASYLTGFSGDSSYVVLSAERAIIISDGRYTTQLADECPGLETHIRPPSTSLQQATSEVLAKLRVHNVGFDGDDLSVAQFETLSGETPNINWKSESGRVESLRAVKDDWELEQIQSAISMAERAFTMFRSMLRGKDTEKELADDLEMYVRRAGGRCSSFPPIVAAGPRAALPHAHPTDHRLDNEGFLLIDWGAKGQFYNSDLTRVLIRRTTATSSARKDKLRGIYEVVAAAQLKAIAALRPGVKAGEVDGAARSVIDEANYGDNFTHSIGHGIGMQVHEAPMMRPNSDVEIKAGMVVTIEPGIYIPGWGGVRIEDDVLVTADGPHVLTSVNKGFDEQTVEW